ncbi:MAG: D12 class N6 adenine-specific DNA methyltransferase [Candidatus Hydrogenedentes bacterium ADurb.Bin179]|nr:MAG: D12 class N6 adenine-specific DNA methyltransferase [Candidatus Hydrogenedentes bacterium ADurb.Bin179]
MIEKDFDIPFIADLALKEKQIQQNYRPIIAVHKWFARRPGTLFRGLLLSEFSDTPLRDAFYQSNEFPKIRIADPFMGGGTPLLEANRMGCAVIGFDINPMSYWIVKQEIEHLNLDDYDKAATSLHVELGNNICNLYRTRCVICGNAEAQVKYFLWVKTITCQVCGKMVDLFPGYLISSDTRHPKNVFVCSSCGQLTETDDRKNPGKCRHCGCALFLNGPASRNSCKCLNCGASNRFPNTRLGPPKHRLFAIEYYCQSCKNRHSGRFFKSPDDQDFGRVIESETRWAKLRSRFVPNDIIPSGDETNRLHRWGYNRYMEMFNARQLLGLELSAQIISRIPNERVRNALATNLSDLLRYQNMLCRYDTMALKSLDIFSVHGFPVGLIQCESNILGIIDKNKNICVGSGGWKNITEKFRKAKSYCDNPFEVRHKGKQKEVVPIKGEWIGDNLNGEIKEQQRIVEIHCGDSAANELPESSLDAVFTDPPYFGNVQYAELMDFCYVWLRRLIGKQVNGFGSPTTRNPQELTGNIDMGRGLEHFTEGLSVVFQRMSKALKTGAPLSFTYHHNSLEAYLPVAVAVLDAGMTCSASLPCPAEMSASIHINGTGSSIIDTIFVCRSTGFISRKMLATSAEEVASLVRDDLVDLQNGNVEPSLGDTRCIAYGHLIRLAIWNLRSVWDKTIDVSKRIIKVSQWLRGFGGWPEVEKHLNDPNHPPCRPPQFSLLENTDEYGDDYANVSF